MWSRVATGAIASFLLLLTLMAAGCSSGRNDLTRASSQLNFGVKSARMNLWREALFRFRRASQIDPQSAIIANNLAVAYEGTGDFEKARETYIEALRLDRKNEYIQKNYSRFTEFYVRNKKRDAKSLTQEDGSRQGGARQAAPGSETVAKPADGSGEPPLKPADGPLQKPVTTPPAATKPDGGVR